MDIKPNENGLTLIYQTMLNFFSHYDLLFAHGGHMFTIEIVMAFSFQKQP